MERDQALAHLQRVKRLREQAAAETEPAIVDALNAGIGASEVARAVGVSDSHVRALRRKHGIPADPRYVHLRPPRGER